VLKAVSDKSNNLKELVIRPLICVVRKSGSDMNYIRGCVFGYVPQNLTLVTDVGAEQDICCCWLLLNFCNEYMT